MSKLNGWARILLLVASIYYISLLILIILGHIVLESEITGDESGSYHYQGEFGRTVVKGVPLFKYINTGTLYQSAKMLREQEVDKCIQNRRDNIVDSSSVAIWIIEESLEETKAKIDHIELVISDKESVGLNPTREQYDLKELKLDLKASNRNLINNKDALKTYSAEVLPDSVINDLNVDCVESTNGKYLSDIWYHELKINYSVTITLLLLPLAFWLLSLIIIRLVMWIIEGFKIKK